MAEESLYDKAAQKYYDFGAWITGTSEEEIRAAAKDTEQFWMDAAHIENLMKRDEDAGVLETLLAGAVNIPTSFIREAGHVATAILNPIDTGEALLRVAAGYAMKALDDSWEAYLPADWAVNKEYANAINDFYADRYGSLEEAAAAFAKDPISVALDVFIVGSVANGALKSVKAMASATNKVANTAKGTVLEGETASKAAAVNRAASEVEKAAKSQAALDEVLVYNKTLKKYVPVSSVGQAADAARAAEMLAAGKNIINRDGTITMASEAAVEAAVTKVSRADMIKLADGVKIAKDNARTVREKWMDVEDKVAAEAFWFSDVVPSQRLVHEAKIAHETAVKTNRLADGKSYRDGTIREEQIKIIALEQDIKRSEAASIYDELNQADRATAADMGLSQKAFDEASIAAMGTTYPIRNAAQQAAHEARLNEGMITGATKYPIMNNAQRAALERKEGMLTPQALRSNPTRDAARALDDAVKMEAVKVAEEAKIIDLAGQARAAEEAAKVAEASKVAEIEAQARAAELLGEGKNIINKDGTITMSTTADVTKAAETAKVAEAIEAVKAAEASRIAAASASKFNFKPIGATVHQAATASAESAREAAIRATGLNLTGDRTADGSFYARDIHSPAVTTTPDKSKSTFEYKPELRPEEKEIQTMEVPEVTRPGWKLPQEFAGSTTTGNYYSADFEDEYWNTPAGVQEAIGVWGRPVGNRIGNPVRWEW